MEEKTFGARLKEYRKAKNMTQQELAEKLGVSDKSVSRWESDGGYPDVPTLVALARTLGVTVDALIDPKAPEPVPQNQDWKKWSPYAVVLGGGVVCLLLISALPWPLYFLGYLAALAYGVYLQKRYRFHTRWFLLVEAVMTLFVFWPGAQSLVLLGILAQFLIDPHASFVPSILEIGLNYQALLLQVGLAGGLTPMVALLLTLVVQYGVLRFGFGVRLRLRWEKPVSRHLLPALIPLLAGLYWLPGLWLWIGQVVPGLLQYQEWLFFLWLGLLGVLFTLPLLKKGSRRHIATVWALSALCTGMLGLRVWNFMAEAGGGGIYPYQSGSIAAGRFLAIGQGSWGTIALALVLALAGVALAGAKMEKK